MNIRRVRRMITPSQFSFKSWFLKHKKPIVRGLMAIGAVLFVFLGYIYVTLPNVTNLADRVQQRTIRYYDRTGKVLLYESYNESKRVPVALDTMSPFVKNATIAIEDKTFYQHQGFNLQRLIKATLVNIVSLHYSEGASTLTQQLVKNAILTREKAIIRKLREIMLAIKLEQAYNKDEILAMYLNEMPYGGNVYGVEAAAQTYFKKSAKDVTLGESAVLAALLQRPSYYSPYGSHKDALMNRQQLVLNQMVEQGYVTKEQADAAKAEQIAFVPRREAITAPHFIFYVRDLLEKQFGTVRFEQGGFSVITTLDANWQKAAEDAVAKHREENKKMDASNAAVVAMDTATGEVRALVGSADFFDETIDGNVNVTTHPRQPGSSIKPFVYADGFSQGLTPDTTLFDLKTTFINTDGKPYIPVNYDGKDHGPVTLRQALAMSLNIPAVKVLYLNTIPKALDLLRSLGYTTIGNADRYGLSLVLGGLEVNLLEHTNAYVALARDGQYLPYHTINKITDLQGEVLYEFDQSSQQTKQVLPTQAVRELSSVLSDNAARAPVFGAVNSLTLSDRPVAAKTGTTNSYIDAWTMGYIPQAAVGVWVGNNNAKPMNRAGGSRAASPIWQDVMRAVAKDYPVQGFTAPDPVTTGKPVLLGRNIGSVPAYMDKVTGQVIPDSCIGQYPPEYVIQTSILKPTSILRDVVPGDLQGAPPENPEQSRQFQAWDAPIQEWAKQQTGGQVSYQSVPSCTWRSEQPAGSFELLSPKADEQLLDGVLHPSFTLFGNSFEKLRVLIDGEGVYDGFEQSPAISLPLGLSDGSHQVTVRVTSAEKNMFEHSVNVTVQGLKGADFTWSNERVDAEKSADQITAGFNLVTDKSIQSLDCYLRQGERSSGLVASIVPVSGSGNISFAAPSAGVYQLSCRLNFVDGKYQLLPTLPVDVAQ